jgi:hypothetical protein
MNEELIKQKLQNASLPAPAEVWEELFVWLQQKDEDGFLKTKLENAAYIPSSDNWLTIENELDQQKKEEQIVQKIHQAEIPSPLSWEYLEAKLLIEQDSHIAEIINRAEVTAPPLIWSDIEQNLPQQAKVISIGKSYKAWIRIAAAAIIVGVISWGAFQLFTNRSTVNENLATNVPQNNIQNKTATDTNEQVQDLINTPSADQIAHVEPISNAGNNESNIRTKTNQLASKENSVSKSTSFTETNYLLVIDENGDLIRVSKKLSTMDCVKNSEVSVDAITALQLKNCDEKIKKLQQQMATAASGILPDPGLFTN